MISAECRRVCASVSRPSNHHHHHFPPFLLMWICSNATLQLTHRFGRPTGGQGRPAAHTSHIRLINPEKAPAMDGSPCPWHWLFLLLHLMNIIFFHSFNQITNIILYLIGWSCPIPFFVFSSPPHLASIHHHQNHSHISILQFPRFRLDLVNSVFASGFAAISVQFCVCAKIPIIIHVPALHVFVCFASANSHQHFHFAIPLFFFHWPGSFSSLPSSNTIFPNFSK